MFRRTTINSEEFIFYLDLEGEFLKKKTLTKSISNFIKEKGKFNSNTTYGLILFQSDDNPVTCYNEVESEIINDIIEDRWEKRELAKSYFENGLFEALSYIFRKSKEARKNYRIIVITDTPSRLSEEYHNALYDLLIKARYFNTFIDIIRVGDKKFYEDDVKLKVITSETYGGVFYCNEARLFQDIMLSLVQNKSEFAVIQPDEQNLILKEDKIFYEKLAVDLISLDQDDDEICDICEREMCPVCEAYSDEIHKCYNCDAKYHACCAAEYSIVNHVGFKHLFRCIKCDTLLKLEEDFVELIYSEEQEEHKEVLEQIIPEIEINTPQELVDSIREKVLDEADSIKETTTDTQDTSILKEIKIDLPSLRKPPSLKPSSSITPPKELNEKKVKVGGYFGQEIIIKAKSMNNEAIPNSSETIVSVSNNNAQISQPISITSLRPPKKTTIKLCKICGNTLSNIHTCPTCGAKVD
ncbi:MAG: hypothetical protein ACFFKA_17430 [Candidatus Thorarchaeota archaeon]